MRNAAPRLVTVGTVALDTLITPRGSVAEVLGGSASYFALAASRSVPVGVIAAVGGDFPARHLAAFRRRGIQTGGILRRMDRTSFRWKGRYSEDLATRETLDVQLGIFEGYAPEVPEAWRAAPAVFLANGDPGHQLAVLAQMRRPRLVVCDTMNLWIGNMRREVERVFRRVHGVTVNDEEARQFTGEHNLLKAARRILRLGPAFVVIKKGEHGCLLQDDLGATFVPAYPLEDVRDPTGAGDSFAGGLMGHLARTGLRDPKALRRAVLEGTVWGSFAVESLGPRRLLATGPKAFMKRHNELRSMLRNATS